MPEVGSEDGLISDRPGHARAFADAVVAEKPSFVDGVSNARKKLGPTPIAPRRTPRVSLIVVLPENHVVSPDRLAESLRAHEDQEVDVIVACAGQPTNLSALQRSVGDAQFLLAPAGTSTEDLRELAMRQVPGDIVTLLSGAVMPAVRSANADLFMTS